MTGWLLSLAYAVGMLAALRFSVLNQMTKIEKHQDGGCEADYVPQSQQATGEPVRVCGKPHTFWEDAGPFFFVLGAVLFWPFPVLFFLVFPRGIRTRYSTEKVKQQQLQAKEKELRAIAKEYGLPYDEFAKTPISASAWQTHLSTRKGFELDAQQLQGDRIHALGR